MTARPDAPSHASDRTPDRLQLNRPLIQYAAGPILALRCAADAIAAFLLLVSSPAGETAGTAVVPKLLLGFHVLFAAVAFRRYRRGTFGRRFVALDVLITTAVMVVGAHYSEGVTSPVLYLLLVQIAGFVVIFGPAAGRLAALAGAVGVVLEALVDALRLWPVPGAGLDGASLPRVVDFGTMLAASALFLIGVTRTLRWARAKEEDLQSETARARAAAEFQSALARLALAALAKGGLAPALALLCEGARRLLESAAVVVRLLDGGTLVARAADPPAALETLAPEAVASGDAPSTVAARERRAILADSAPAVRADVPPGLGASARRVLALPLLGQNGRLLGTFTCADDGRPRDLGPWRVRAELVAALAAAAIERAGLVDRLQEEAQRVGALLRVSQEIERGRSHAELGGIVRRLTRELLVADRALLLHPDDAADGASPTVAGLPAEDVEEWRHLRAAMATADPDEMPNPLREAKRDGRLIVAPLCHGGRVHGLLTARRTTTPGRFDARQIALLEGIARQTAMALDNLRLLEQERNTASLATTLLEVARELNLALDLATLLSRLAVRAVSLTGAAAGVIALWRPRESVYRVEAVHGPAALENLLGAEFGEDVYDRDDEDVRLAAAWRQRFAGAFAPGGEDVTEVSVPMERGGERAGVLTLVWAGHTAISARARGLARGLAYQAAIALQNVRLLEDIREASRVKSEFVATMSHELRTPLNVILGYLNLFLEDAFGTLDAEPRSVLARMQRSAWELFDLVTATLDLNRLEAGKSRVTVERLAVRDLLAQLELETAAGLHNDNVEIRWQVASDLPALETDRAKLRIVLKNLIGNAIKFTERGNVTVAAERAENGAVVFTVTDTGVGMRREDVPVIFEMFRQVECANTRRHGGVGLGLYIVKRLLTELRGEIDVESELGVGSRFRVRLPLRLPEVPRPRG